MRKSYCLDLVCLLDIQPTKSLSVDTSVMLSTCGVSDIYSRLTWGCGFGEGAA